MLIAKTLQSLANRSVRPFFQACSAVVVFVLHLAWCVCVDVSLAFWHFRLSLLLLCFFSFLFCQVFLKLAAIFFSSFFLSVSVLILLALVFDYGFCSAESAITDDGKQFVKEPYMRDMEPLIAANRQAMHSFLHDMTVSGHMSSARL